MTCKIREDLTNAELNYEPKYSKSDEIIEEILESGGNPDKYITEESRKEADKIAQALTDHFKICEDEDCKRIRKNRLEAGLDA
jgi:hypothetical protein